MNVNIMQKIPKEYKKIREINIDDAYIELYESNGKCLIYRKAIRGNVVNIVSTYEMIDKSSLIIQLNDEFGHKILDRIESGSSFSDAFIFNMSVLGEYKIPKKHSDKENMYTSTGVKFWRHPEQMKNFKNNNSNSVISTHISPEGSCNLKCSYCSVTYRDTHSRIPMNIIQDYVLKMKSRGLKAVIITGGGEPTAYKHFNDLVRWLDSVGMLVALVTNGSKRYWDKIDKDVCKIFSWVRVSINIYDGWTEEIQLPIEKFDLTKTVIGCSFVYSVENQSMNKNLSDNIEILKNVKSIADKCNATYIRILPNCLLDQDNLLAQHAIIDDALKCVSDDRFFHQYKIHGTPNSEVCHQSYFRPYLSEEVHSETGLPGTVYPCDSVVLNNHYQKYAKEYELCHASEILQYLDGEITHSFNASKDCSGCVHYENVNMLELWKKGKIDMFSEFQEPMCHENFV